MIIIVPITTVIIMTMTVAIIENWWKRTFFAAKFT